MCLKSVMEAGGRALLRLRCKPRAEPSVQGQPGDLWGRTGGVFWGKVASGKAIPWKAKVHGTHQLMGWSENCKDVQCGWGWEDWHGRR